MYKGILRFIKPSPLEQPSFGIIIMLISLVFTLVLIVFQNHVAKKTNSQAIRADAAHYTVDVLTNAATILTLIIVKFFDIAWFDSLAAILISFYLIKNAWKIAKDAIAMIMDKELSSEIREKVEKIVLSCSHIEGMHDLRSRDLGSEYIFEFHLELDGNLSLFDVHQYCENVENKIKEAFPNSQVLIHQDPAGLYEDRLDAKINYVEN